MVLGFFVEYFLSDQNSDKLYVTYVAKKKKKDIA